MNEQLPRSRRSNRSFLNLKHYWHPTLVRMATLFAVALLAQTSFAQAPPPNCFIDLGLDSWSVEGNPSNGNWVPSPDGSNVRQTINSNPSFYVSNAEYFNTTIQGEFRVETGNDDDFIGFVMGYKSPNSGTPNNEYRMILFDWKQALQTCAAAEMRLSRIQGTSADLNNTFWCQTDPITNVLARSNALGGWADNTTYTFQVEYGATNISVWVNGTQVFDVDGSFESGRFGFYNYSQEATLYQNFSLPFSAVINKTDVSCTGANDGAATAVVSDFATGPYNYLWSNNATTQSISGLAPGDYSVVVTSQDGCTANASVTIGTTPDNTAPTAVCQDVTVTLDGLGNASITAAEVNNGSSDNCGIASYAIDRSSFTCSDLGSNAVTLTVTDTNGNTASCMATVTVQDTTPPSVAVQDITRQLSDPAGVNITPAMVVTSASDNCSLNYSLSQTNFSCADIGTNVIQLTTSDNTGNTVVDNVTVTITAPEPYVVTTSGVNVVTDPATASTIDSGVSVNFGSTVNGALISIADNLISGDVLSLNSAYTLPAGVTASYNAGSGILTINGSMSQAQAETLFRNVQFSTTSSDSNDRTIQFTLGNSIANTENGHYYEYIVGNFTWQQAKADAATRSLYGLQGYLATVTSLTENDFIRNNLVNDGWLGGSDDFAQINSALGTNTYANQGASEGLWHWVTGPEAGTQFSTGGTALPGEYANWNTGEPNNSGSNEHYLQIFFANEGRWNDLPNSSLLGYIVEYGGLAGDNNCYSFSGEKVLQLNQVPIITAIDDATGCPGTQFDQTVIVSDVEDATADITVTATSNNQSLVTDGSISVSFNGTDFDLSFTPQGVVQGSATITVTATDTQGASSTEAFIFTSEDTEAPVAVCQNITVQLDANGQATITAGDIDNGSTDNCGIASRTIDVTSFNCSNVGTNSVILTVDDGNGNTATCTSTVTVEDNVAPTASCVAPFTVQLDANGQASITAADIDNSSTDACGVASTSIDVSSFDCSNVGDNTVTLTVTDVNGNSSTCTTIVTVEDNVAPTASCVAPFTVQLDANGEATISVADIDDGSTDACGVASTAIDVSSFDCSNVGDNPVTLTVTDNNGNSSTCTTTVTVQDNVAPIVVCPADTTANTDPGDCFATVIFADAIAFDACGIASVTQTGGLPSGSQFPVGVSTVEFTAVDVNGNSQVCSFTVTVADSEPAVAVCQDITVQLDASGVATIAPSDLDGGSTDNCGVASLALSQDTFDCSNVGANTVTLLVTDNNGNVSTCAATVTVEDLTAPVVACQDVTVQLGADGTATVSGADIDNGSTDACGIVAYELDTDTFDCSMVGDNLVTLTVTDANGNQASCTATVTVEDTAAPVLACKDITLALGADGTATITAADVIDSLEDNCAIATTAVDITEFDCADIGTTVQVQVFAQDSSGNLSTCFANVSVVDDLAPVVSCPGNQTVDPGTNNLFYVVPDYFAEGSAAAQDNCTDPVIITSQEPAPGSLLSDGTYTVTLTAEDAEGNLGTCSFELTVESVLGTGSNLPNQPKIALYPNPATNAVHISNPSAIGVDRVVIYDLTGRMVKTVAGSHLSDSPIDISELASATYMVMIYTEHGAVTHQLLKE
ncbi:MAG: hypothetical protein CMC08_00390 [Flavobacteriaceae bacterium]|nr:hypothetical protein [Flavobacteriaceae bacterium]